MKAFSGVRFLAKKVITKKDFISSRKPRRHCRRSAEKRLPAGLHGKKE